MTFLLLANIVGTDVDVSVWKRIPIEVSPESVLYTQVSNEAVACTVEIDIRNTGEVAFLTPLSCPDALWGTVRDSLMQWRFHPPTQLDRSVSHKQKFTAVFESGTVLLEPVESPRYAHVRVPPVALPQWPYSPDKDSKLTNLYLSVGLQGGSCVLETSVGVRGQPVDLVIVECPNEVALNIERSLKRWGMKTIGAALGSSTRYRLEVHF